jgi:hypothetical protein
MRRFFSLFSLFSLFFLTVCCDRMRELSYTGGHPGEPVVRILVEWSPADLPFRPATRMRANFLPQSAAANGVRLDLPSDDCCYPASVFPASAYRVFCYDFYGNENITVADSRGRPDSLAASFTFVTGVSGVSDLPGGREPFVLEPSPLQFYCGGPDTVDLSALSAGDTAVVRLRPRDIVHEFTFLIYDVPASGRITGFYGSVSGMSSSYYFTPGVYGGSPCSVLFGYGRSPGEASPLGVFQPSEISPGSWSQPRLDAFFGEGVCTLEDWPDDYASRWGGNGESGWLMGAFRCFAPLPSSGGGNVLSVFASTRGGWTCSGSWGGNGYNAVGRQLSAAFGDGTLSHRLAWRRLNGGFDVVLANDGVLDPSSGGGGGFVVTLDPYGDVLVPL